MDSKVAIWRDINRQLERRELTNYKLSARVLSKQKDEVYILIDETYEMVISRDINIYLKSLHIEDEMKSIDLYDALMPKIPLDEFGISLPTYTINSSIFGMQSYTLDGYTCSLKLNDLNEESINLEGSTSNAEEIKVYLDELKQIYLVFIAPAGQDISKLELYQNNRKILTHIF